MTTTADTTVVTGPNFNQQSMDTIYVTPTGGTQTTLAAAFATAQITGGTITGATINGSVIGGVTPAAATFTTVSGTAFTGTYFTASEFFDESVGNALTAAGTTRADALALTAAVNNITTAGLNTGAVLPASATIGVGGHVIIYNAGANPIKVYGAGSDTIDGTAGSTGVTLTNSKRCEYRVVAANTIISAQLGVTSA